MNTQERLLPDLDEGRIDDIEHALFADIGRERRTEQARRIRRGRIWVAGGAAAAVIAVGAIIAPTVGDLVRPTGRSEGAVAPAIGSGWSAGDIAVTEDLRMIDGTIIGSDSMDVAEQSAEADRDIITTASATVVVADVAAGASQVADAAQARGGYVESSNVGTSARVMPIDPSSGMVLETIPYPYNPDGAWVSVRVPASELSGLVDDLSGIGEVTASAVNRQDVTAQTIDLEARISAAQASVDRLTELMGQAGSLSDLIAAESALSERQATLESYQQQLDMLGDQVAMSSLTVALTPEVERVEADPAGFLDGVSTGWNGLVATLNGIVIAIGFLLPWLVVIAVTGFVVWGVSRAMKRRRQRQADAATRTGEES